MFVEDLPVDLVVEVTNVELKPRIGQETQHEHGALFLVVDQRGLVTGQDHLISTLTFRQILPPPV
jgi:hypothetical protein